ncbi:hypothetical protein IPF37_02760 [bacterium]|nr:MAG: hypothetical protein IPF37_02760 [bacterium]
MKRLVVSIFFLSIIFFQAAHSAAESDLSKKIIACVNSMGLEPFAASENSSVRSFVGDVKDFIQKHEDGGRVHACCMNDIIVNARIVEDAHSGRITKLVKLDDYTFASSSWDNCLKVWSYDVSRDRLVCAAQLAGQNQNKDFVLSLALLNDHTIIASVRGGCVKVWQRDDADHEWKWVANIKENLHDHVSSIVVLDDYTIVLGFSSARVEIWSCANGIRGWQLVQTLPSSFPAYEEVMPCLVNQHMLIVVHKETCKVATWIRKDIDSPWIYQRTDWLGYHFVRIPAIERIDDNCFAMVNIMPGYKSSFKCLWKEKWVVQKKASYQNDSFALAPNMKKGSIVRQLVLNDEILVSGHNHGDLEITKIPTLLEIALTIKLRGMSEPEKQEIYDELAAC